MLDPWICHTLESPNIEQMLWIARQDFPNYWQLPVNNTVCSSCEQDKSILNKLQMKCDSASISMWYASECWILNFYTLCAQWMNTVQCNFPFVTYHSSHPVLINVHNTTDMAVTRIDQIITGRCGLDINWQRYKSQTRIRSCHIDQYYPRKPSLLRYFQRIYLRCNMSQL